MKKFTCFCIILSLLISVQQESLASERLSYEYYALKLSAIGVFKGTSDGFELERAPTRLEGLVIFLRLIGKEDEIISSYHGEPSIFADVTGWGIMYTNYAYNNNLSIGIGNGNFGAQNKIVARDYHTLLLRALGYSDQKNDFTWKTSNTDMLELGIIDSNYYRDLESEEYIRGHVAKSSYLALYTNVKGTQQKLIDLLLLSGDITYKQMNDMNVIPSVHGNQMLTYKYDGDLWIKSTDGERSLEFTFAKCGINKLFAISNILMTDPLSTTKIKSNSDWVGPYIVESYGTNINLTKKENFTGGWHGYNADNSGETARTNKIVVMADGKLIESGNPLKTAKEIMVIVTNQISGYNTTDYILEEVVTYLIYDQQIDVSVTTEAIQNVSIHRYYGLQTLNIGFNEDVLYYLDDSSTVTAKINQISASGTSKECHKYVLTSNEHSFKLEAWLDQYIGLGNFNNLDVGLNYAFTASYGKSYFNLINGNKTNLTSGQSISWKGGYFFH